MLDQRITNRPVRLTEQSLRMLKPGSWASDRSVRGMGQLQARRLQSGVLVFYFRYTNALGKQERLSIGKNISLVQARQIFTELSMHYQRGERDLRTFIHATPCKGAPSLGELLQAYVLDLELKGRSSAEEVKNALRLHVKEGFPTFWGKPAQAVQMVDVMTIIRHVNDQGKSRQADKLRSYIKAAYNVAINAKHNPNSAKELQRLQIIANPAREIMPVASSRQAKVRSLSIAELQAYWLALTQRQTSACALLRFHVLTGGQRIEQLAKAVIADLDPDQQILRLLDPKGRRQQARIHEVPLLSAAIQEMCFMQGVVRATKEDDSTIIQVLKEHSRYPTKCYVWSISQGKKAATYHMASQELKKIIQELKAKGQITEAFTLGDIRRTIETRLAALGISKEVRAQLLSHGISGVQDKHYDRHDYLKEKKDALIKLHKLLGIV